MVLGITQEQHPDRLRLFAQWQQFGWPILWDPINWMESSAVPIVLAIDEHGIVRAIRPKPETFQQEFLNQTFRDDAPLESVAENPSTARPARRPDLAPLRQRADKSDSARKHRDLGDALVLWGGEKETSEAIAEYATARRLDAADAAASFRLGVAHRLRHDSSSRQPADFQQAIAHWEQALAANPNQYIWRRRIQQFGPRLDKPYPFYDWVEQARREVIARGEQPLPLIVDPYGAEIASPVKNFAAEQQPAKAPDLDGKITRDKAELITGEVTLVPSRVKPGGSARVHLTLQPNPLKKSHWNNEADPLLVWIDPPAEWQISQRLHTFPAPKEPTSHEVRRIDFEVQAPANATGKLKLSAYALYFVCDDELESCLFLRHDFEVVIEVAK